VASLDQRNGKAGLNMKYILVLSGSCFCVNNLPDDLTIFDHIFDVKEMKEYFDGVWLDIESWE
jgi:hypothetical protein